MKFFLKNRIKSDKANSLITAILVFPVLFIFLVSMIDFSIYLADRGQIQGIARDGARTVAIMGGNGDANSQTPIERKYGVNKSEVCANAGKGAVSKGAVKATSTAIECNIMNAANNSKGLVNVQLTSVLCNPYMSTSIGETVTCEVKWTYKGIPGSAFSFVKDIGQQTNVITGTAQSEVTMDGINLIPRINY